MANITHEDAAETQHFIKRHHIPFIKTIPLSLTLTQLALNPAFLHAFSTQQSLSPFIKTFIPQGGLQTNSGRLSSMYRAAVNAVEEVERQGREMLARERVDTSVAEYWPIVELHREMCRDEACERSWVKGAAMKGKGVVQEATEKMGAAKLGRLNPRAHPRLRLEHQLAEPPTDPEQCKLAPVITAEESVHAHVTTTRASTSNTTAEARQASTETQVLELFQEVQARHEAIKTDPSAFNPEELMGEFGEFIEMVHFLQHHGIDFMKRLLQNIVAKTLARDLNIVHALRGQLPGTLDRTTLAEQGERQALESTRMLQAAAESREIVDRLGGPDVMANGTVREHIAIYRPFLKMHREMCKECEEPFGCGKEAAEKEKGTTEGERSSEEATEENRNPVKTESTGEIQDTTD